jgi:hypothetical protein
LHVELVRASPRCAHDFVHLMPASLTGTSPTTRIRPSVFYPSRKISVARSSSLRAGTRVADTKAQSIRTFTSDVIASSPAQLGKPQRNTFRSIST